MNRSKVVPLGAAPGYDDASTPDATGTSRTGRATSAPSGKASPKPGTPKPTSAKAASAKAAAAKAAAGKSGAGNSAATASATSAPATRGPAVKRPGKRPGGAQEKRLRERAELSGAIRSGTGPGTGSGHGTAEPPRVDTGDSPPVPARAFSGRMLALAVILAVVTVLLLPSVGTYMDQRAEIAQLQASIAEKQQQQADLKTQIARWDDPAYVKAQARNRINLVMPGEKKYMVIGATGDDSAVGPQSVGDVRTDLPWVDSLWDTVVRSATD
ncbi:MAG TPA: septum formation initiator family protein [Arthrobacter sp.]|nr:septum formation initiator family protein [Arthrobacter sp.]